MPKDPSPMGPGNPARPGLGYVFLRFLRYGWLAWGGPFAQLALMHKELVSRDHWVPEPRFRKLLAVYQVLPGPEAHEIAVYLGMTKRGRFGGFLAGLGFMLPGVLLVTLLAHLYVNDRLDLECWNGVVIGVRAAVVALVAASLARLSRRFLDALALWAIAIAAAAISIFEPSIHFLWILLGGSIYGLSRTRSISSWVMPATWFVAFPAATVTGFAAVALVALETGLLTFGGAYTAVPILHRGAVIDHGWLTEAQFLDALALCALVPGPLIAVGVFIAYVAGGPLGALVATILIFTPAFALTLWGHRYFERLLDSPGWHNALYGVTAAVLGVVAATVWELGRDAWIDPATIAIGLGAFLLMLATRLPVPVTLAAAGLLGWFA